MDKETSSRVSSIAAKILNTEPNPDNPLAYGSLLADAKILAGSALSQDETPGQETAAGDFFTRLKDEREDLDRRLIALNSYGHPNPRHRKMLEEQSRLMSDLLAVLDERIADIEISRRSSTENDNAE